MEIRDRLHQMEHLDKMLDKLIEQNGGKVPTREQFLEENNEYWDTRLAEQALDDLMSAQTGISGANLQAMRRASAPSWLMTATTLKKVTCRWKNSWTHEVVWSSLVIFRVRS